jgi:hypothetical protein
MELTLHNGMQAREVPLARGIGWGLVGGLAGTLVMDAILMAGLSAVGLSALICFSIVGNTVAQIIFILGIEVTGGVQLGIETHYLIGPLIGAIFAVLVTQVKGLRVDTLKKSIVFAVLYVEILSQPILATTPILLKMNAAETMQWFGISFVMHFLMAVVLGAVVSYGLRLAITEEHK